MRGRGVEALFNRLISAQAAHSHVDRSDLIQQHVFRGDTAASECPKKAANGPKGVCVRAIVGKGEGATWKEW